MNVKSCKKLIEIPANVDLKLYTVKCELKGTDPDAMTAQIVAACMAQHFAGRPRPSDVWVWNALVYAKEE